MLFKNLTRRKYVGLVVIVLSVIFLVAQIGGLLAPYNSLPHSSNLTALISLAGITAGVYLLAGPIPTLITAIPLAVSGCIGGGGGGGEGGDEDLGEPPEPPSASIYNP